MNVNIAICDDERIEITYLSALVRKWAATRSIDVRLVDYENAESFLFAYEDNKTVDILLLDIQLNLPAASCDEANQMKNMDGVELARRIRKDNEAVQIIFITGYPDYIAEGYDVSALHYLMKPVKEDKLLEVLDKAVGRLKKAGQTLLVQTSGATVKVPVDDIIYIEAFAHYIEIQTKTTVIETRANIGEMEKSVGNAFFRCHRSYIVGLKHISGITKTDVTLDNGKIIPLSRRMYTEINLAFIKYHRRG